LAVDILGHDDICWGQYQYRGIPSGDVCASSSAKENEYLEMVTSYALFLNKYSFLGEKAPKKGSRTERELVCRT